MNNNQNRHVHITLHKFLEVDRLREEAECVCVDPHGGLRGAGAGAAHRAHLQTETRDYQLVSLSILI